MSRPAPEVREALRQVTVRWDPERTAKTLSAVPSRRRRRVRRRLLALSGGAATVAMLFALGQLGGSTGTDKGSDGTGKPLAGATQADPADQPELAAEPPRVMGLSDGSTVTMLGADTRITKLLDGDGETSLTLTAGRAAFHVVKRAQRSFRVLAGPVTVSVLGTRFEVERRPDRTRVTVREGRVAVRWAGQRRELGPGEGGWFLDASAQAAGDGQASTGPETGDASQRGPSAEQAQTQTQTQTQRMGWRSHAQRGDFKRAYALLKRQPPPAPSAADLLLAADAARLSGHPRAAVPYLRQVVERHPNDARAALAAFTLGGVLMNELGLPREAEAAYRQARSMTESAALAQDALARQVEAAHRAGDAALARELAEAYVERYPHGRRLTAVRRFGQLP